MNRETVFKNMCLIAATEEAETLRRSLAECVSAWERWYPKLPSDAQGDEFGAFLRARSALASAAIRRVSDV
jgi:hypothetical protein